MTLKKLFKSFKRTTTLLVLLNGLNVLSHAFRIAGKRMVGHEHLHQRDRLVGERFAKAGTQHQKKNTQKQETYKTEL